MAAERQLAPAAAAARAGPPPEPQVLCGAAVRAPVALADDPRGAGRGPAGDGGPGVADHFLQVEGVSYKPPGVKAALLDSVTMSLPRPSLGLVFGASGSGKTTLLQVLAGLATPTTGAVILNRGAESPVRRPCTRAELAEHAGIVFQFPERYFLADSVIEELTFGWPRGKKDFTLRQELASRLQSAASAVGLSGVQLDTRPRDLSDGYKRRLALAVQLVRRPDILLLDEPLAGLDWRARLDVVRLLAILKKQHTIVVVSHDLRELAPLVDKAWNMRMGGRLVKSLWPPPDLGKKLEPASASS
eukprot:SM000017S02784  [mRNA]  locus=s17:199534:201906:+ [translate_table: standard]